MTVLLGPDYAGQYKILLLLQLAFLSVFNSMNLINSSKFAHFIDSSDDNRHDFDNLLLYELKNGLFAISLCSLLFFTFNHFFNVFTFFDLSPVSTRAFFVLLISPVFNILIGPVNQLFVHHRLANQLILGFTIRLVLVILPMYFAMMPQESRLDLLQCVSWLTVVELVYLISMAMVLHREKSYIPPLFLLFG